MENFLYLAVCFLATLVGAVSGIGGGVIIKPAFDLFSGMTASTIGFLSGCTVLSMTLVSLVRARGDSIRVEKKQGTLLGIGGAVGGGGGKLLFDLLRGAGGKESEQFISGVQNALMVLLTLGVLVYSLNRHHIRGMQVTAPLPCLSIGVGLGLAGAFLGIGGGPINLVVLTYFFSMDTKTAALTSLYIIFFSQLSALLLLVLTGKLPAFDPTALGVMVAGGVAGGFFGRTLSKKLTTPQVDRLFLAILLLITLISAYNVLRIALIPA